MDPDACVREMVGLANLIADGEEVDENDARELAEMVCSIDGWLRAGGFIPERWNK